jgi:hypothetical protein
MKTFAFPLWKVGSDVFNGWKDKVAVIGWRRSSQDADALPRKHQNWVGLSLETTILSNAMRHSLYKYYSERKWAEAFLDGELLFRSLAYFRDYEDKNVRGDQNEGTAILRPDGGLLVNNVNLGTTFTVPAFEASANQEEILIFCASRSDSDEKRKRFKARVCVEILGIKELCQRVEAALPPEATFHGRPGHTRIGHAVKYYRETENHMNPQWALPGAIATSKLTDKYLWQDEYRLLFSLTGALALGKSRQTLRMSDNIPATKPPNPAEHRSHLVRAGSLRDICLLHEVG